MEQSVAFDSLIDAGLPGTLYAIEHYLHGVYPTLTTRSPEGLSGERTAGRRKFAERRHIP